MHPAQLEQRLLRTGQGPEQRQATALDERGRGDDAGGGDDGHDAGHRLHEVEAALLEDRPRHGVVREHVDGCKRERGERERLQAQLVEEIGGDGEQRGLERPGERQGAARRQPVGPECRQDECERRQPGPQRDPRREEPVPERVEHGQQPHAPAVAPARRQQQADQERRGREREQRWSGQPEIRVAVLPAQAHEQEVPEPEAEIRERDEFLPHVP